MPAARPYQLFTMTDHTLPVKKSSETGGARLQGLSHDRDGITYSMNIVALRCMADTVTPQLGVEYAERLGITSLVSQDQTLSTALGGLTKGVSNLELTNAFAAIANGGTYTKPIFFTKILDRNGKILIDNEPETRQALKDSTAYLLTSAMQDVMQSNTMYTRSGSRGLNRPVRQRRFPI